MAYVYHVHQINNVIKIYLEMFVIKRLVYACYVIMINHVIKILLEIFVIYKKNVPSVIMIYNVIKIFLEIFVKDNCVHHVQLIKIVI